jgi:4-hydroxybenzoate polyprenyltransferase
VTSFPSAFLGLATHIGFIAGFATVVPVQSSDYPLFGAYVIGGCAYVIPFSLLSIGPECQSSWTLLHDTIYACQDMKDDMKMGVNSGAILFTRLGVLKPMLVFFGVTLVVALSIAGYLNEQTAVYYMVGVGGTILHLLWQAATVDLTDPASCWSKLPLTFDDIY